MKLPLVAAVLLFSCLPTPSAHAQRADQVVAQVGHHSITFGELAAYADDGLYHYLSPTRSEAFERALDDLLIEELKRIDLFATELSRDSVLIRSLSRNVTEELVLAYGKHNYEDQYLNESRIRAEHEKMGRVVLYRQVDLTKPADTSPADVDALRSAVTELSQQFEAGIPFDVVLRTNDGLDAEVRPVVASSRVTWEQTVGSPHAHILFDLPPGAVRSFETPTSFSIAQVDRIEETPVRPLDEVRQQIVDALHRRHAVQATQAFRSEWTTLVDTTALRWHGEGLAQVVAWFNSPGFIEGDYGAVVKEYLAMGEDALVMTDGRGDLRLSDLPEMLDDVLAVGTSGGHEHAFIQGFLLEAIRTKRLADRARAAGFFEEVWRADTPSPVLAQAFVRFYNEWQIEDRIPEPTDAALREFYRVLADSLFYQLARVNTEIIVRSNEDEIEALWEKVQQGLPFSEVSHRRLIRSFERTRDGKIVTRFNPEPPYLGGVAFGLDKDEVASPVVYDDAEQERRYAIVRVTGRMEERQLAFDEIPDRVAKAFVEHHRGRIAAQVAADLRARYPVKIHREVLDRALAVSQ